MKAAFALLITIAFFSFCDKYSKHEVLKPISISSSYDPISGSDADSVNISSETTSQFTVTKGYLRNILRYYPELYFNDFLQSPDITYALRGKDAIEKQSNDGTAVHFECELCQDDYYLLYAFFLELKYGCGEYNNERQHLIAIYREINSIMQQLAQGGTYFGHQYVRVVGYAAYSTYLLSGDKTYGYYRKEYDILNQKRLYVNSLKQFITDELNNNFDIAADAKPALKKDLFETVARIDGLITNYFYLSMTQEFQYSHY